jgi:hypothetical protein
VTEEIHNKETKGLTGLLKGQSGWRNRTLTGADGKEGGELQEDREKSGETE